MPALKKKVCLDSTSRKVSLHLLDIFFMLPVALTYIPGPTFVGWRSAVKIDWPRFPFAERDGGSTGKKGGGERAMDSPLGSSVFLPLYKVYFFLYFCYNIQFIILLNTYLLTFHSGYYRVYRYCIIFCGAGEEIWMVKVKSRNSSQNILGWAQLHEKFICIHPSTSNTFFHCETLWAFLVLIFSQCCGVAVDAFTYIEERLFFFLSCACLRKKYFRVYEDLVQSVICTATKHYGEC